ncbi:MAG TPA: DinB family protein [Candidatus Acidoferrum sp.]|nr:DinB family protein [Candidatus Acidoferrum sp.]
MNATPPTHEPWLRGTLTDVNAVPRAVLHALELAGEDLNKWCASLTEAQLNAQPHGLPSVGFQLRHIARSIDRLLTYAEGNTLSTKQLDALRHESQPGASPQALFDELSSAIERAAQRVRALAESDLEQTRAVGKKALPTTLGGLLVHVADHTQRHVGQAITTTKILLAESERH